MFIGVTTMSTAADHEEVLTILKSLNDAPPSVAQSMREAFFATERLYALKLPDAHTFFATIQEAILDADTCNVLSNRTLVATVTSKTLVLMKADWTQLRIEYTMTIMTKYADFMRMNVELVLQRQSGLKTSRDINQVLCALEELASMLASVAMPPTSITRGILGFDVLDKTNVTNAAYRALLSMCTLAKWSFGAIVGGLSISTFIFYYDFFTRVSDYMTMWEAFRVGRGISDVPEPGWFHGGFRRWHRDFPLISYRFEGAYDYQRSLIIQRLEAIALTVSLNFGKFVGTVDVLAAAASNYPGTSTLMAVGGVYLYLFVTQLQIEAKIARQQLESPKQQEIMNNVNVAIRQLQVDAEKISPRQRAIMNRAQQAFAAAQIRR